MQRHYKLRPSRLLVFLFLLFSMILLFTIWSLPLPFAGASALTVIVLCRGLYGVLIDASLGLRHSCVAFGLEGEEIVLVLRNGNHLTCRLCDDSVVTPYLVILNVELNKQNRRRSLVILSHVMGKESFRRLRVALKWGDHAAA
jgi:hypothetical protein